MLAFKVFETILAIFLKSLVCSSIHWSSFCLCCFGVKSVSFFQAKLVYATLFKTLDPWISKVFIFVCTLLRRQVP